MIFYSLLAIIVLTATLVLARGHDSNFCPICIATVAVWGVSLALLYFGPAGLVDPLFLAVLMGASVGAVATKYGNNWGLLWKTSVVVIGTPAVYFAASRQTGRALAFAAVLAVITVVSASVKRKPSVVEDRFKNCC